MKPYYEAGPVTLYHGDCRAVMATLPDESVHAVVTDPPYELTGKSGSGGFMGKSWDSTGVAFDVAVWSEALRVLKPGGHLLAFGGSRTYHRMAVAIEDAGFELRDSIAWLYGCLSDDTEILTSEGWVRYDRATEGQHALAFDTATGALAWQAIQHVHRYPYAGEMVRLHSEHTDQLLTPNHRVVLDEGRSTPHTPYVPSDQDLRRLLTGVPGARPLPVGAEADVLAGVRGSADLAAEEGQGQAPLGAGRPYGAVRDVRDGDVEAGRLAQEDLGGVLLEPMQRRAPGGGVGEALPQGQGGLDRRQPGVLPGEDNRAEQPRMEGRRYRVQEARELCRSAVRASAGMGATDGPQGRIHHGAPATDGRPLRVPADQAGSHQPREPRPQGQPTGEPDPLAVEPGAQALRVGEDGGGRLLPSTGVAADVVDYAGVVWCITVPHGAFIARRNGLIFATGNSGFPKSLDVSKAIDKAGGASPADQAAVLVAARERAGLSREQVAERVGCTPSSVADWERGRARAVGAAVEFVTPSSEYRAKLAALLGYTADERRVVGLTVDRRGDGTVVGLGHSGTVYSGPETTAAKAWDGWGTALKPSHEPVVCARKPLVGTVIANVLEHGTGALNIDATRIDGVPPQVIQGGRKINGGRFGNSADGDIRRELSTPHAGGRWPTNVVLDESQAEALDEQSGNRPSGAWDGTRTKPKQNQVYGHYGTVEEAPREASSGGASRFFPTFKYEAKAPTSERPVVDGVAHATVKPLKLMQWLVRLVTPPGGVVLDPFAGSGTTLEAAVLEGFDSIGIELEEAHLPLIKSRFKKPFDQYLDLGDVS